MSIAYQYCQNRRNMVRYDEPWRSESQHGRGIRCSDHIRAVVFRTARNNSANHTLGRRRIQAPSKTFMQPFQRLLVTVLSRAAAVQWSWRLPIPRTSTLSGQRHPSVALDIQPCVFHSHVKTTSSHVIPMHSYHLFGNPRYFYFL